MKLTTIVAKLRMTAAEIGRAEERKRRGEILGPVKSKSGGLTKTVAEAKKMQLLAELNGRSFIVPSSKTFANAVKHYREVFAPRMLRDSTFSIADGHLRNHLEPDWNNPPVSHISIKSVNDWAWKKKRSSLSWLTVKNILRTMQRVLSASSEGRVPFSHDGLAIPERDKNCLHSRPATTTATHLQRLIPSENRQTGMVWTDVEE
jgi:hypothetical protein